MQLGALGHKHQACWAQKTLNVCSYVFHTGWEEAVKQLSSAWFLGKENNSTKTEAPRALSMKEVELGPKVVGSPCFALYISFR